MGWLHTHNASKRDIIDELLKPWSHDGVTSSVIAHSVRGNNLWMVYQQVKGDEVQRFIGLALLSYDRECNGYGYKAMDESMGPSEVNCPLGFLDMAPAPECPHDPKHPESGDPSCGATWSRQWRKRVRAYHETQNARRKSKPTIGKTYRLVNVRLGYASETVRITGIEHGKWVGLLRSGTPVRVQRSCIGPEV